MGKVKVALIVSIVAVAAAGGLYWLFRPGDAPPYPPGFATAATLDWTDLIPPLDQAGQERLPDGSLPRGIVLHGQLGPNMPAPAGDPSTQLSGLAQALGGFNNLDAPPRRIGDAYAYSGLGSLKGLQPPGVDIRPDLDGKIVKIAGFVTPLSFTAGTISDFLLVPFVGACIHVPPPPANQIVYVSDVKGYRPSGDLLYPVWVTGKLKAVPLDTDLANVGYQIAGAKVEPYDLNPKNTIPISGY